MLETGNIFLGLEINEQTFVFLSKNDSIYRFSRHAQLNVCLLDDAFFKALNFVAYPKTKTSFNILRYVVQKESSICPPKTTAIGCKTFELSTFAVHKCNSKPTKYIQRAFFDKNHNERTIQLCEEILDMP